MAYRLAAKGGVFVAKSAYTGTIWGVAGSGGDLIVNGNKADIGRDFGMAYLGGTVGSAFEGAGEVAAAGARRAIDSSDEAAASIASNAAVRGAENSGLRGAESELGEGSATRGTGTAGPRHRYSPGAKAASGAIGGTAKVSGAVGGAVANQLAFSGGAPDPKDATKDALEDVLNPSVGSNPRPRHAVPIRPVLPIFEPRL